eukprot:TRINITY_DN10861_c0_g1_i1.p1 TRINITY_DN10861_c0_g1~~TRINITY_DN10861_c0_g1_i1.p1  ORF type:complete len:487 (-),score=46.23 TRINITY_DN10861_c0_g1_i1:514-1908(-)
MEGELHSSGDSSGVTLPECGEAKAADTDTIIRAKGRSPSIDVTRTACVLCVCLQHSYSDYGSWNVILAQSWAFQLICVVSGICFGLARTSLPFYVLRLGIFAVVGYCMNFFAHWQTGYDVMQNPLMAVYHMAFCICLAFFCVWAAPLRLLFRRMEGATPLAVFWPGRVSSARRRFCITALLFVTGGFLLSIICWWPGLKLGQYFMGVFLSDIFKHAGDWRTNAGSDDEVMATLMVGMDFHCRSLYIAYAYQVLFPMKSIATWLIIANMFLKTVSFPLSSFDHFWHVMDLMLLGLVAQFCGLWGRRYVATYMTRYWFFVVCMMGILTIPGASREIEMNPYQELGPRVRQAAVEVIAVVFWLVSAESIFDRRMYIDDKMTWISMWGLVAFISHDAAFKLLGRAWGWVFIFSCILPCMAKERWHSLKVFARGTTKEAAGTQTSNDNTCCNSQTACSNGGTKTHTLRV